MKVPHKLFYMHKSVCNRQVLSIIINVVIRIFNNDLNNNEDSVEWV